MQLESQSRWPCSFLSVIIDQVRISRVRQLEINGVVLHEGYVTAYKTRTIIGMHSGLYAPDPQERHMDE